MLLGHPVTITSNLPVWDTEDVHRHCDKTSVTAGSPASSDLFKVAQEKPKQNCVGWYNCQQFCKNGSPGFHKHCLGCCKASHPSQEENCTLKKDHSPHNLGSLFFSFGLLRDYSLSHMPWHHSWIGTDTPNKPESLQHPLFPSLLPSCIGAVETFHGVFQSSEIPSAHLFPLQCLMWHSLEQWCRLKGQHVAIGDFSPFPKQLSCFTSFTQSGMNQRSLQARAWKYKEGKRFYWPWWINLIPGCEWALKTHRLKSSNVYTNVFPKQLMAHCTNPTRHIKSILSSTPALSRQWI